MGVARRHDGQSLSTVFCWGIRPVKPAGSHLASDSRFWFDGAFLLEGVMQQLKGSAGVQANRKATLAMLDAAGIRRGARDLREYERAKLAILAWQCNGSLPVSYQQAVRIAADLVGV